MKTIDHLPLLIKDKNRPALTKALEPLFPFEISKILARRKKRDQIFIFSLLPAKKAAETFNFLPADSQKSILQSLPSEEVGDYLKMMTPDDRTELLEELPTKALADYLSLLSVKQRDIALKLLGYPEDSVGRMMTPDYIGIKPNWSVKEVFDHIRAYGRDSETINELYVLNEKGVLIDDIKLKDFLFVPPETKVNQMGDKSFVKLSPQEDVEDAIPVFQEYGRSALPVVDEDGKMCGIVTMDDILRRARQEGTEDIQVVGGTDPLEAPYMHVPFFELIQKRAKWLVILFLGEMFTATAMAFFEDEIAKAVVLALFLPLIISSGGNAGSQSTTLIVRALALGEVTLTDWWRIMKREFSAGLCLGVILGIVGFARIAIWSGFSSIYGPHWILVAVTIFFALIAVVLWGSLIGSMLPLILRRVGFDPAVASAPLVATLVDVTGIVMYFLIAVIILRGTLL